jgi:hypothetical protein
MGLPLMGTGDWNDGMNLVGMKGKGESIWLGFFLCEVMREFAKVARLYGDAPFADRCEAEGVRLHQNIEQHGWDGQWYRRAYFDDGTPLGSASNPECQIDSIAQSWSVLSGAVNGRRSRRAMNAVYQRLVRRDVALVQLLDPAIRQVGIEPWLHHWLCAGSKRERRTIHARCGLDDNGFRGVGRCRACLGACDDDQSDQPRAYRGGRCNVPCGTLRRCRRRLCGRAAYRPRRLDLVHRFRRLDVPDDRRIIARIEARSRSLRFAPCLPAEWTQFTLDYRYRNTIYHITILQTPGEEQQVAKTTVSVDGVAQADGAIPLVDDGSEHSVEVRLIRLKTAVPVPVS